MIRSIITGVVVVIFSSALVPAAGAQDDPLIQDGDWLITFSDVTGDANCPAQAITAAEGVIDVPVHLALSGDGSSIAATQTRLGDLTFTRGGDGSYSGSGELFAVHVTVVSPYLIQGTYTSQGLGCTITGTVTFQHTAGPALPANPVVAPSMNLLDYIRLVGVPTEEGDETDEVVVCGETVIVTMGSGVQLMITSDTLKGDSESGEGGEEASESEDANTLEEALENAVRSDVPPLPLIHDDFDFEELCVHVPITIRPFPAINRSPGSDELEIPEVPLSFGLTTAPLEDVGNIEILEDVLNPESAGAVGSTPIIIISDDQQSIEIELPLTGPIRLDRTEDTTFSGETSRDDLLINVRLDWLNVRYASGEMRFQRGGAVARLLLIVQDMDAEALLYAQ